MVQTRYNRYAVGDWVTHKGAICEIVEVFDVRPPLNPDLTLKVLYTSKGVVPSKPALRKKVVAGATDVVNKQAIEARKAQIALLMLEVERMEKHLGI